MTNLMYFSLFGGVMMLLFGIRQAGDGLQRASGPHLKQFLNRLTANRVLGLLLGILITVFTQSSSATTAMLVGFVNSGLMQFAQTLGVILGADIGTTVTVQLIAFNITDYAIFMAGLGILVMYTSKGRFWKDIGQSIAGFGFVFLSLHVMSDAMAPLKESESFRLMLVLLKENPLITVLISAVFTGLVHSSAATIGIALPLAAQGLIGIEQAIPIIFGANIGTSATAIMLGLAGTSEARRVAYAHTLFKLVGVAIFFPFIGHLAELVRTTSPDAVRQIANAHTFFNVALALLFLPFTGLVAGFLKKAVKDDESAEPFGPKYLDEGVLSTPSLAMSQTAREILRMADIVQEMFGKVINGFQARDEEYIEKVEEMDDHVDKLDRSIRFYLTRLSDLSEDQSRREFELLAITSDLETIGDIIDKNVMSLATKRIKNNLSFSVDGFTDITDFHQKITENFGLALAAFTTGDHDLAERVMKNRDRIHALEREYRNAHIERLKRGLRESYDTSAIHLDLLTNLERINSHITHIAFSVIEGKGLQGTGGS